MHTFGDGPSLLDLLREAGDEAVTFDELELVGISDPARALWELELEGFTVHRVFDERKLCVRLDGDAPRRFHVEDARTEELDAVVAAPAAVEPPMEPAPAFAPAPAPVSAPAAAGASARPLLLALAAFLLVALFARRAR